MKITNPLCRHAKGVIISALFAMGVNGTAYANQHIHSLSALERQNNQRQIQQEYVKDNPRTSDRKLVFEKVSQNVYIAKNYGANAGLVVGDDALLLIETKDMREQSSDKLVEAIRRISDKPIKYVINTHSHFDHSGGNAYFARLGATVIAQENYRYTPIAHQLRFDKKLSLTVGDEEVVAYHTPSHTLDSTIIYLPNSNVLFMGDNYSSSWLLYEGANGVSEFRQTMDLALTLANDKTIVVPGHGELSRRKDLLKSMQAKSALRQRLGDLYAKGWTVKQMSEDRKTQSILATYQGVDNDGKAVHLRTIQDVLDADYIKSFGAVNSRLNDYTGHYKTTSGKVTEIVVVDGKLIAREEGTFIAQLKPVSNTLFDLVGFPYTQGEQIEFVKDKSGKIQSLKLKVPNRFVMNHWLIQGPRIKERM